MKLLLSYITCIAFAFSSHCQTSDSSHVIDNVSIIIHCERDTSVQFYSNAELNWLDSSRRSSSYEFIEGDQSYLELSIAEKCEIKDGSSHEVILIRIDPHDTSSVIHLDSTNTYCLSRYARRYGPSETPFSGTLDFNNHTLTFHPSFDSSRNILWEERVIRHWLIRRREVD